MDMLKISKKAQGISLDVIIIAAIALVVLVILSVIFMGRIGVFSKETSGTTYCEQTLGGKCAGTDAFGEPVKECETGTKKVSACDDKSYCCKSI